VQCVEGQEPLPIDYGEHTIDCQIDDPTDTDRFSFYGSADSKIRVKVSDESGTSFAPRLEIWDPHGDEIVDTWDTTDISVDATLATTGVYLLAISDHYQDYSGEYTLQLEKMPPVLDPPGIPYDSPVVDVIDHVTDMDFLIFAGEEGAHVRINVSDTSGTSFAPRLEIWDPYVDRIVDTWDTTDISVDATLAATGVYLLAISDHYQDYPGECVVEVQCLTGPCPDPPPPPAVSGCIGLRGAPSRGIVILQQAGEPRQIMQTDAYGCYEFADAASGKRFRVFVLGPSVA